VHRKGFGKGYCNFSTSLGRDREEKITVIAVVVACFLTVFYLNCQWTMQETKQCVSKMQLRFSSIKEPTISCTSEYATEMLIRGDECNDSKIGFI
jgi:hypothetical protein